MHLSMSYLCYFIEILALFEYLFYQLCISNLQMNDNKLDVPTNFVVPAPPRRVAACSSGEQSDENTDEPCVVGSDDAWPWPEYLWGFPLGQRLRDIRVKGNYMKGKSSDARRRQLDALGFN